MSPQYDKAHGRMRDILEAIADIDADTDGMEEEAFLADGKTQRAVISSLVCIGEAANRIMSLAPDLEVRQPDLWENLHNAYDMRNFLTHEYFRVDTGVVWATLRNNIPELERQIRALLSLTD